MLGAEFKRSQRYGIPFAIAMADVDRSKSVNDEHGHPIGDLVLKEIARTMRDIVRETDCGGRFGGEEFLAVLGSNDVEGGRIFAERWRQGVEAIEVPLPSGEMLSTSISIGVSAWTPALKSTAEMVERADAALYMAKGTGRNRVYLAPDDDED